MGSLTSLLYVRRLITSRHCLFRRRVNLNLNDIINWLPLNKDKLKAISDKIEEINNESNQPAKD